MQRRHAAPAALIPQLRSSGNIMCRRSGRVSARARCSDMDEMDARRMELRRSLLEDMEESCQLHLDKLDARRIEVCRLYLEDMEACHMEVRAATTWTMQCGFGVSRSNALQGRRVAPAALITGGPWTQRTRAACRCVARISWIGVRAVWRCAVRTWWRWRRAAWRCAGRNWR